MDKESVDILIKTNPKLQRVRDKLEALQMGSYVMHRSWGLGKINRYDQASQKLIIDFEEGKDSHAMDPGFSVDKLEVLSQENILVKHREDPEAVEAMIKDEPTMLIAELLSQMPEQSATANELERTLSRLLGTRYKKWWTATKKLLVKDPQIAVPSKKTDPFVLRDEPVKPEEEILIEFFDTKAPKKKIGHAEKLLALSLKHEDIKESLPDILQTLTDSLRETKQLTLAERLHGVWIRNDLARFIHEDPEQIEPTSASLLRESHNLSSLAENIPGTFHKRFLSLVERTFVEDWQRQMYELLRNSSGKLTTEVINHLLDKGQAETIKLNLQRWLTEQGLKGPVIFWIIKNRNSRKYSKLVSDLMSPRLLAAIFHAIDHEALQKSGNRRIPLADLVVEDQEIVAELLADATADTAYDLATALMLNQGFEDLSKKSLLARFIKRFPNIQSIVASDDSRKQEALIVSKTSFELRKKEYDELISEKIPANKEAIAVAREHGDLKENSEYKMARQDQDTLLARKNQLEVDLARAQTTDFSSAPTDVVGVGSVVELRQHSSDSLVTYSILGAWDSDPDNNVLSYETPLGQGLLSKQPGDTVTVEIDGNSESWTIQSISRWVDRQLTS